MALTTISEGATSTINDLNQVVNLLNGTTTNTQVTVNGPISAQLSGTAAPMRYVGGREQYPLVAKYLNVFASPGSFSDSPFPSDFDSQGVSAGTYYRTGDLSWAAAGGPVGVYSYIQGTGLVAVPIGNSGYVARVHQAGAFAASTTNISIVTGDTIDYDPRGMVQPSYLGNGIAITIPFFGIWGVAAAVHSSGVNNNNISWAVQAMEGTGAGQLGVAGVQISSNADNTHKYTGSTFNGFFQADAGMQIAIASFTSAPAAFNLDVSGPDRTYISVWHAG